MLAAAASPAAAYAEEAVESYPDLIRERLAFKNLNDYAIGESADGALFADGSNLILWTPDEKTQTFGVGSPVTDVDYADGKYYYATADGAFVLPASPEELPGEKTVHDFEITQDDFADEPGYHYFFDANGSFCVFIESIKQTNTFDDYKKIKPYGGTIYAIKSNVVYTITDGQPFSKDFYYSNYSLLTQVPVYDSAAALKQFSESPQKVNIRQGCSVTELNPEIIAADGEHFSVKLHKDGPDKGKPVTSTDVSGAALLLAEAGGTRVIAKGDKIYMLNKANTLDGSNLRLNPLENTSAIPDASDYAYSLPFISNSAALFEINTGDSLKVIASVPKESNSFLAHDFYLVEKNGVRGYVAAEFLNDFSYGSFNDGGAGTTPDPSPETGNSVRTVVLVLLVILLVLIAAGYLTWLLTGNKKAAKCNPGTQPKDGKPDGE